MVIFLGELLVLIIFIGNAHRNAYAGTHLCTVLGFTIYY